MLYQTCKNCGNECYHEILEEVVGKSHIHIECRCKLCMAVTTTRYATRIEYQKVVVQPTLFPERFTDDEHHEPNEQT